VSDNPLNYNFIYASEEAHFLLTLHSTFFTPCCWLDAQPGAIVSGMGRIPFAIDASQFESHFYQFVVLGLVERPCIGFSRSGLPNVS
jgi:hypothetical protein